MAGSTLLSLWNPREQLVSRQQGSFQVCSSRGWIGLGRLLYLYIDNISPPRTTWREILCWGSGETAHPSFAVSHSYITVGAKGH